MPRAPARIRRRYVDGANIVSWDIEESLVFGFPLVFGPPSPLRTADEWGREWAQWRSVIEPKVAAYLPGRRAFAQYVLGEIPRRTVSPNIPQPNGFWFVDVIEQNGTVTRHPVDVPEPWVRSEIKHLHDHGLLTPDEIRRARTNPGGYESYPLETASYE